jgi:hypothetical protein
LQNGLKNLTKSPELDDVQKQETEKLTSDCQEIFDDVGSKCKRQGWGKWKEHRCKAKKFLKNTRKFKNDHSKTWEVCQWKEIKGYGSFFKTEYDIKVICAEDSSAEIVPNETSNCTVCDEFGKMADEETVDLVFKADCKEIEFQLRIVFKYKEWDNSQKKGWVGGHIKRLVKKHPGKKDKIMNREFGNSGNDMESFVSEGCDVYEKVQGLPDIFSGNVSENPILKAMRNYTNDTSNPLDKSGQMRQFSVKLSAFFEINTNPKMRLSYYSSQSYQFLLQSPGMEQDLSTLKIVKSDGEEWGQCYDITFSSAFCSNYGCGNKTGGPGKFPAMSDRGRLITPDAENKTILYTAIEQKVNTFNSIQKPQMSTTMNNLKSCIHSKSLAKCKNNQDDNAPGSECRVNCINDVIRSIVATLRIKITVVQLPTWYGEKTASSDKTATVGQFCGCS